MNRFSSLLVFLAGEDPKIAQSKARRQFAEAVRRSKFSLHRPTNQYLQPGTSLILGVASYSSAEMQLLDDIEAALANGNGETPSVAVFDVLDCDIMSDFGKFINGLDSVYQTPVLGVVVNGQVVERAIGLPSVEKLLQQFHALTVGDRPAPSAIG